MNTAGARRTRFPWRLALAIGLALIVVMALGFFAALQPTTADRFGYALSGPRGLPGHFTYQGVTYSNGSLCAGGSVCAGTPATRWSRATFEASNEWPLHQVATLPTLLGASHAIYEPVYDPSMLGAGGPYVSDVHPLDLFIQDPASPGWYYLYQRPGGP